MKLITKDNILTLINGIKQRFYSKDEIDQKVTEIDNKINEKNSTIKVGQDFNSSVETKIFFKNV